MRSLVFWHPWISIHLQNNLIIVLLNIRVTWLELDIPALRTPFFGKVKLARKYPSKIEMGNKQPTKEGGELSMEDAKKVGSPPSNRGSWTDIWSLYIRKVFKFPEGLGEKLRSSVGRTSLTKYSILSGNDSDAKELKKKLDGKSLTQSEKRFGIFLWMRENRSCPQLYAFYKR